MRIGRIPLQKTESPYVLSRLRRNYVELRFIYMNRYNFRPGNDY